MHIHVDCGWRQAEEVKNTHRAEKRERDPSMKKMSNEGEKGKIACENVLNNNCSWSNKMINNKIKIEKKEASQI